MRPAPVLAPAPSLPTRLRTLARQVERLGVGGRTDPERVVLEKLTVAAALRRLAKEIET